MKKALLCISTAIIMASSWMSVHATVFEAIPRPDTLPGPSESSQEDEGIRSILVDRILPRFAIILIGFTGGVALVFVIIGGVRFAMSYGNEENVEKAKKQVFYGVIGFLIAILAYTIVTIIVNLRFTGNTTNEGIELPAELENSDQLNPGATPLPEPESQAA